MTIDQTLDDIMQLDETSREMLLDILQKRQVELRRARIAKNAKEASEEFHAGNFISMGAEEAIKHLDTIVVH